MSIMNMKIHQRQPCCFGPKQVRSALRPAINTLQSVSSIPCRLTGRCLPQTGYRMRLNFLLDHDYIRSYLTDKGNKSVTLAFNALPMIAMQKRKLETVPENKIDTVKLTVRLRSSHLDALYVAELAIIR